jgi:hypothetical protein
VIVTSLLLDQLEIAAEMFPAIFTHHRYAIKLTQVTKATFIETEYNNIGKKH